MKTASASASVGTGTGTIPIVETASITSTKVIAAIIAQVQATANVVSMKRNTAATIVSEAKRLNLTEKKAILAMVMSCWLAAYGMDKAPDAQKKAFEIRSRPDMSKIMTLAYPEAKAKKELEQAFAHNDKLPTSSPKQERIGENKLLEIARGNMTFKQAISLKAPKTGDSNLDKAIPKYDRFRNGVTGLLNTFKVGAKDRLSSDEAYKAFHEALEAWLKPAPTPKANAKAA